MSSHLVCKKSKWCPSIFTWPGQFRVCLIQKKVQIVPALRRKSYLSILKQVCKLQTFAEDTSTPRNKSAPTGVSTWRRLAMSSPRSNMGIDGQKRSEKWCRRTNLFLRTGISMCCRWLYSIGTTVGTFPALTGLFVDHAKLCAEPQATWVIFFPEISKNWQN